MKLYAVWGIVSATIMLHKPKIPGFYPSFIFFIVLPLLSFTVFAAYFLYNNHLHTKIELLAKMASALNAKLTESLKSRDSIDTQTIFSTLESAHPPVSFILINSKGRIEFSSANHIRDLSLDYSFFPDVRAALSGQNGWFKGTDFLENKPQLFYSIALKDAENKIQVLRLAQNSRELFFELKAVLLILVFIALLFALFAWYFSRRIQHIMMLPIIKLQEGAERFASGDLKFRLYAAEEDVSGRMARILNKMAAQLDQRIRTVTAQKNEQDAIFAGMREGVLVVGSDCIVRKVNKAALNILSTIGVNAEGKSIEEVVRNINLQNFIKKVLSDFEPREIEIVLHESREITIQAYTSIIGDADRQDKAVMVVLNDITQLKQLETIRKDFVANVSHELKTPITAIQGFVETLLDGAMNSPQENERFLGIIKRQTERLNAIFNDLLILAGLEKEGQARKIQLQTIDLKGLLESSIEVCREKAREKNITFNLSGLEVQQVRAAPVLLEQALVNLIDNAVKYSPANKSISISSVFIGDQVEISVSDQGMGIESSQLGRIFERFYRVDQSRSREEGGTGLGLSIVKHIALLHEGGVKVESKIGRGSEFSILLPKA